MPEEEFEGVTGSGSGSGFQSMEDLLAESDRLAQEMLDAQEDAQANAERIQAIADAQAANQAAIDAINRFVGG